MPNRWITGGAIAILALFVITCIIAVLKIDIEPEKARANKPVRTHNLGEGIRLTQHGLYGIDLVSISRAHIRKLRRGPFTIGAINEMVLEQVSLTLPEELWKPNADKARHDEAQGDDTPKAMLQKLGINAGSLKLGGKLPRFSALTIKKLRVARLDGTNAVPWFSATSAEAKRGGLALYNGWSTDGNATNSWKQALLIVNPCIQLITQDIQ